MLALPEEEFGEYLGILTVRAEDEAAAYRGSSAPTPSRSPSGVTKRVLVDVRNPVEEVTRRLLERKRRQEEALASSKE